jgi:hypothetical protein
MMGQAKNRGTFEQRQAAALERTRQEREAKAAAERTIQAAELERQRQLTDEQREMEALARKRRNMNRAGMIGLLSGLRIIPHVDTLVLAAAALADSDTRRQNVKDGLTPEGKAT